MIFFVNKNNKSVSGWGLLSLKTSQVSGACQTSARRQNRWFVLLMFICRLLHLTPDTHKDWFITLSLLRYDSTSPQWKMKPSVNYGAHLAHSLAPVLSLSLHIVLIKADTGAYKCASHKAVLLTAVSHRSRRHWRDDVGPVCLTRLSSFGFKQPELDFMILSETLNVLICWCEIRLGRWSHTHIDEAIKHML